MSPPILPGSILDSRYFGVRQSWLDTCNRLWQQLIASKPDEDVAVRTLLTQRRFPALHCRLHCKGPPTRQKPESNC